MLSEKEINNMSEIFKVLGDPTRIKILYALEQEELCVCDLAISLNMKVSAVSHQLRLLKKASLVKSNRSGKYVYYQIDDEHVEALFSRALEHVQHD
ncbi:transcriptional regulator [Natranaerobius trueperi]|uniref:Transcriptional regulator n=2 Tax=Natranaerobius trueperi TaxID=759412 RepID=A0A226BVC7_9FIRM|nr:transcriptional regulator [Natranaerobius trueperi]